MGLMMLMVKSLNCCGTPPSCLTLSSNIKTTSMERISASSLTGDLLAGFFIMLMLCFGELVNNLATRVLQRDGCKIGSDATVSPDHACRQNA